MGSDKCMMEYRIVSIADSDSFKGQVEAILDPVDKTIFKTNNGNPQEIILSQEDCPMQIANPGQIFQMIMGKMPQMTEERYSEDNDPREILWIEDALNFQERGWKYDDRIRVSFEKIPVDKTKKEND